MDNNSDEFFNELEQIGLLVARFEKAIKSEDSSSAWFDAEEIDELCNFYINMSRTDMAQKVIDYGHRLHPTDERIPILQAMVWIKENKAQQALDYLNSIPHSSDEFFWLYLRVEALLQLGRLDEAKESADYAVVSNDDKVYSILLIAREFIQHGLNEIALSYLQQVDDDCNNLDFLELKTSCLSDLKQYEQALALVEKQINLDPYSLHAWQLKATLHTDLGQNELALEDLEYAIAISPKSETLFVAKAKLLITMQRVQQAEETLNELSNMSPKWRGVCLMMQGDIYFTQGNYKKAHSYYKKGFGKEVFLGDSMHRYIECNLKLRKWAETLEVAKFMLQFEPDDIDILLMIAEVYVEQLRPKEAEKILRRALRVNTNNIRLMLRYGSLLLDMKEYKKAYTVLHKAYLLAPDMTSTNIMMAVVSLMQEKYKRMYDFFRKSCEMDPNSSDVFFQLCPNAGQIINEFDNKLNNKRKK